MAKVFDELLLKGLRSGQIPARTKAARHWFRQQAKRVKVDDVAVKHQMAEERRRLRLSSQRAIGKMYFFNYDPKWKHDDNVLPYYDNFPLIFPIGPAKEGFLGLNLHYLPYPERAKLMDALYTLVNNEKYDESTRLKIHYGILKNASKFKEFRPCIKHYLRKHIRSRLLLVDSVEWDIALFLPVAQFEKASQREVWRESRKIIKKYS